MWSRQEMSAIGSFQTRCARLRILRSGSVT